MATTARATCSTATFAAQPGPLVALDYDTTGTPADGIDDIVVGSSTGTSDQQVYQSDGAGTFTLATTLARNSDAPSGGLARASFDGSGGNDFAVSGTTPVASGLCETKAARVREREAGVTAGQRGADGSRPWVTSTGDGLRRLCGLRGVPQRLQPADRREVVPPDGEQDDRHRRLRRHHRHGPRQQQRRSRRSARVRQRRQPLRLPFRRDAAADDDHRHASGEVELARGLVLVLGRRDLHVRVRRNSTNGADWGACTSAKTYLGLAASSTASRCARPTWPAISRAGVA